MERGLCVFALALEAQGYKALLFLASLYTTVRLARRVVVRLLPPREMTGTRMTRLTASGNKLAILAVIGGAFSAQTRDEENICTVTNDA